MLRRVLTMGGLASGIGLAAPRRASALEKTAPVVLELFTSQGCSSCPPADMLLGELSLRPDVMALAWHVDYWNNLGWRDPFARRQWTERQRAYARNLHDEVYTPALVVNGARMVVGSDKSAVRDAIQRSPALSLDASLRRDGDSVMVEIGRIADGVEAPSALLAIYDPEHVTGVEAGENSGRRLKEFRIVRDVRVVDLTLPTHRLGGVALSQGAVLIVQDRGMLVLGAADLKAVS
jgi:hypothetical protein